MAAKIGILGENTLVATGTITVYTVPADKAARVRLYILAEGKAGTWEYGFIVGAPGNEFTYTKNNASGIDVWTGVLAEATPDPALALSVPRAGGIQRLVGGLANMDSLSIGEQYLALPLAADFFLSTGDTVRYALQSGPIINHLFQVIGVEDDA